MAGINFVRRWVMSQMTKKADDGIMITLPEPSKVDLNVNITMDRLLRNGINPDAFTNPQQVDNAVNMVNSRMVERAIPANSAEGREITEKLFGKQKAPVFDLEGNRIPEGSGIMGGKAVKELMDSGQVSKGARGMKKSKKVEDREMFQKSNLNKTEAQLKKEMEASNKKGIANIKNKRQLTEDEIAELDMDIGGLEYTNDFDGTVGSANKLRKEHKQYIADMELEYKKGNLDPEPGSGTSQRKRFLQKKLEEAELSGDARLMSREEREELFDLDDIPEYANGGRIGLFAGAVASGENISPGTDKKGNVRDDNPFTGGGGGENNNNNNPPPVSTNNTTPDTTFFDKTSKSGLMSNISPSILARLARMRKGLKPILGKDGKLGVEYLNEDELYDTFTNFRITQDLEDLIKTKKLEPELKYRKEIGDNTLIEGGINQAGDANIMFKKQFADGGRIGLKEGDHVGKQTRTVAPSDAKFVPNVPSSYYSKPMPSSPKTPTVENSAGITSTTAIASPRFLGSIFDFQNTEDEENFATGGRAGFMAGGMGRRGFLKMLAGLGGGIAAAKTGLLKFAGKEPAKQVAKEVVKQSAGTPPPYFFKLVEKIKILGDDVTEKAATKDREVVTKYKDLELTEDVATGEQTIQRIKQSDFEYYDEQLAEDVYMNYKPGKGQADEATPKVADEYTEDTSYIRTSGPSKGDIYDTVDGIPDDVLEEAGEKIIEKKIKSSPLNKASGGIARMLGE